MNSTKKLIWEKIDAQLDILGDQNPLEGLRSEISDLIECLKVIWVLLGKGVHLQLFALCWNDQKLYDSHLNVSSFFTTEWQNMSEIQVTQCQSFVY